MKIHDVIAANPKACYRTLEAKAWKTLGKLDASDFAALAMARPECGYHCDGDDVNPRGGIGCTTSGRCEE